jgi:aminopeptidase N
MPTLMGPLAQVRRSSNEVFATVSSATFAARPGVPIMAAAALLSCAPDAPAPLDLDEGVPWELAEHRKATVSDVRYAFDLRIPGERTDPIDASGVIAFQWSDPAGQPLVLDFLEPEKVRSASVNGAAVVFERVNDHLVIPSEGLVDSGENQVALEFTAGDGSLNRNDEFLYTLFVPERARFALPVFDQPNLKGRFAVTLTVPEGWTAVANGPLLEETSGHDEAGDPVTTLRFAESRPLPSYLFAFAAGRFQVETADRDGREMRFYHRETDRAKVERNLDAIFDLHTAALAWLEEYTGIDYPFQKFDFVGIPSFQYGGMEHAGSILYRASSLFLEESATQAQYLGRASVIAHETAHMWFGDYVTMNWFDDVWMKEVFANFMAAKIVQPSFPDINHDLRFLSHHQSAYAVDRTAGANAIRQPLDNLREAGTLYGAIIYQKAPVVMRLLERMVGESTFQEGMRHYLRAYAYDNATWLDLVGILDVLSLEDVTAWSRVWVEDAGRPDVEAEVRANDQTVLEALVVRQTDPAGQGRLWPQPLGLWLGYGDDFERVEARLVGAAVEVAGPRGRLAPDFVLPESRALGYGGFRLDPGSRAYLLDHLTELDDAVVRGVAWLTMWEALLRQDVAPVPFLEMLLRGVAEEADELNVQRVLGFLGTTYWRLLSADQRGEWAPVVEAAIWSRLQAAPTTTARAALFGAYRDVALTPAAVERLRRVWAEEEPVPDLPLAESDYTAMAYELAVRGVEGWREVLDRQAGRIENPDRRARFEFVRPALDADPAARRQWFEALADPANREREPWVLTGLAYLHHPLRASESEAFLQASLELVEEIQRTGDIFFPKRWLDATLGGHNTPAAAGTVRAFLEARPNYPPRLRAKILQSADMLFRAADIVG